MRVPEVAGEFMQFLQAVKWSRMSLPRVAEAIEPRRRLLENHMKENARRTKREAYSREGYYVVIFPIAPDEEWSSLLIQVPQAECINGITARHLNDKPVQ